MPNIKVYSTPSCPWCIKAKDYFKSKKLKFMNYNVAEDEAARNEMIEKSGQMSVPVIDIDGKILIGFNLVEIEKALKKK